jgi:hypothetical protein
MPEICIMAKEEGLTKQEIEEINQIARTWTAQRQMQLVQNLQSMGLVRTGKLIRSVKAGIRLSYGELNSIYFKYEWYGLFHEKGAENVGRGNIVLPARHWLAPYVYGNQLQELVDKLSEYYMNVTVNALRIDDVKA